MPPMPPVAKMESSKNQFPPGLAIGNPPVRPPKSWGARGGQRPKPPAAPHAPRESASEKCPI